VAKWDIFCSVVDNYGDIGVTWRLARQLAAEHGHAVRLWVDELAAFARLCPEASATAARQQLAGVELCHWIAPWPAVEPAEVVIEAFACHLPPAYREAMAARGARRLWLNLEYLSAEDWVAGCHGLPSPQPGGLQKFFFFPGFAAGTGEDGLAPGDRRQRGSLQIQVLPFMAQDDYDRLLWCCDLNAVRGEDSFVRAQWAGRPLLWHIYQQEEGAHWDKLEAFLALYGAELSPAAAEALGGLCRAWNAGKGMGEAWERLLPVWPELAAHAERWCSDQAARPDLATALEQFYRNWLSYAA
jgi:hypothetical protein